MSALPDYCVRPRQDFLEFDISSIDKQAPYMALSLIGAGSMSWQNPSGKANRFRFYRRLGVDQPVHAQKQIHSHIVHAAGPESLQQPPQVEGDGLFCSQAELFLSVTVADCMPIWIWNRSTGEHALLHSGWRGTGILADAVTRLLEESPTSKISDISVLLGPSIGSCCYRVDQNRYRLFRGEWGDDAVEQRQNGYYLSLGAANKSIADSLGVGACYIYNECTFCNPEFGSFRREGPQNFTSMLALSGYFQ